MFLLLIISLGLGWVLARYWLKLTDWPGLFSVALSLAFVSTLTGVNFFYRQTVLQEPLQGSLAEAVFCTLMLQFAALVALWMFRDPEPPDLRPLPRWLHWTLLALGAVVLVYTNAQQIANPDDDYWIHAPLQGLMRHDNFPPFNPFFSDIPMNGHYGRNLSIVSFSFLSGADVFMSQHLLTSLLQVVTLLLFYTAFYASSERHLTALLGTFFVFFGINAGGRGGLIDTMQNNNAFVHLYLALLCYLTVMAWKKPGKTVGLLGGLTLGSYAIVYETHFGLVFLTILGVTPLLWIRKLIDKRKALCAFSILALSLPLAFTQGGPLTDLLERKLEGRQHSQAEQLSKGMQNQAQVVKVTFPKKELFQILLETGEYQRTSHIYRLDTPLNFLYKPSTERGYAYIWSWDVLKLHFLPLYLVPWSAFILWRRGSLGGLFMGAFGTIAFLVPALVHFGPIYESEYYRWEFAAALGFAGALGLTLSTLVEKAEGQPVLLSGSNLVLGASGKRYLLLALVTLLNSYACFTFVGGRFAASVGPDIKKWLIFPSTQEWLSSHPVLNFDHLDYDSAMWLQSNVKPEDRVLANFNEENNFSILYESTLTGITGARCVGHALPLEDEKIGTTPFRRSPAAQLFWQTGSADALAQLQVDWLFVNNDGQEEEPEYPSARLIHRFRHGDRSRLVYKVNKSGLPRLDTTTKAQETQAALLANVPKVMRGGQVYGLSLRSQTDPGQLISGTLVLSTVRGSDGLVSSPAENLQISIEKSADDTGFLDLELPFVAPYDEGDYELLASYHPTVGTPGLKIPPAEFASEFTALLKEIRVDSVSFPEDSWAERKPWPARVMMRPLARLQLPNTLPQSREILACWAFYSEERAEFDLLPGINLRRVRLSEELAELPLITPERPGEYRLALYLSAGQGHLIRIPALRVTIGEQTP